MQLWERFDPHATHYMDAVQVPIFVRRLGPPLGIPDLTVARLMELGVSITESSQCHILDVYVSLVCSHDLSWSAFVRFVPIVSRSCIHLAERAPSFYLF